MADIKENALELIGNTPLLRLNQYAKRVGLFEANVIANNTGLTADNVIGY